MPYTEISSKLGIPIGSFGRGRCHCIDRLRRDPAVAACSTLGYAGPSDRGVRRPGAGNERATNLVLAQAQRCADGQKVYCITCSQDAVFPG